MDSELNRRVPNDPLAKALTHGLAIWAIVALSWILVKSALLSQFALDFRHAFLPAAHAVVHGASPYSAVSARMFNGTPFLYPPVTAYLLAPFTLLPPIPAEILAEVLFAASIPAALLLLGVRDWRCYVIAFLWWPTIIAIQIANLTLPMVLGLAVVWRYRDKRVVAALVTGLVVAVKLFFWPVIVWLIATRRYRTAALAAAWSALLILLPWAGIGFAGFRSYPHLLSEASRIEGPHSYSIAALLSPVLPTWTAATAVEMLFGATVLILVFVAGRRGSDRDAFALSIVAILLLSPLIEIHYLALLLVVIALYHRRFGLVWVLPLLIWGAPGGNVASLPQIGHVLAVTAATIVLTFWHWRPNGFVRAFRPERPKAGNPAPLSY